MPTRPQSGQAMVLVAFALLALIGSAALVLLAGSFESQRNQLQQLADEAALDSALKINAGCSGATANVVITEADSFVLAASQRTRIGGLGIAGAACTTPYTGTSSFSGGLNETIHYPYRAHQQQVEVILTLTIPISFGGELGATNTTVVRRAVAQQLSGSVPAVSATTLSCTAGQVNVAGSIAARNLITRGGICAFYAHQRFDAASGTYSDLGNVTVYTDGQTWTAPGTCAALLNTGSSRAICADGYELSGHTAPACAAGGTSYLSLGDAAINANPCAAGKARQPVPPLSAGLPPEPDTDAAAIATLPGNVACSPATVYPNLTLGAAIVGTAEAGTPPPTKDAAGYYHFKPSCYGYLNVGALPGSAISNRQTGVEVGPTANTVKPTLPGPSAKGTLLVVNVSAGPSAIRSTATAGWVFAAGINQPGEGRNEIWYYPNNPGAISIATFTLAAGNSAVGQMTEWSGVLAAAPLDRTGVRAVAVANKTATVSTAAGMTVAGELAITNIGYKPSAGATYTAGPGWNSLKNDPGNGYSSEYRADLGTVVATETVKLTVAVQWSMVIASFKPAGGAVSGAVFDPGFYYFNGSGFAGGGGICLNGSKLLARDVTLEFVNRAGFSSGTCAAGGGAGCAAGACQLGSTPCSISVCPPNAGADPPNNLTWLAAPCSSAPAADAASCSGSAWCPVGDRACWNLLIWAPASVTGQVALKGAALRAWLLGSVYWPGTCTDAVNGTSTVAGTLHCGTLSMSAAVGAGTAVGSDYGINTATAEAILVE